MCQFELKALLEKSFHKTLQLHETHDRVIFMCSVVSICAIDYIPLVSSSLWAHWGDYFQAEEMLQEKRKERERARRIRLQELEKKQREVNMNPIHSVESPYSPWVWTAFFG